MFDDALKDFEQEIFQLSPLSDSERQHLISRQSTSQKSTSQPLLSENLLSEDSVVDETLVTAFEKIVLNYPQHTAVQFENTTLNYAELNKKANRLAHFLQNQGVKPETRVGLCLERSENMVVAILGVLKAGGTYVPLDPNYPPSRLEFILDDSGISLVLTEESVLSQVKLQQVKAFTLDSITNENQLPDTSPQISLHSQNSAYIIYTSGSTGTPKGCVVTHGNVIRLLSSTEAWFGFNENDIWTLFHSFAFDFSVWELWGGLLYGGKVVVVPFWLSRSPHEFREFLATEAITVLSQTPSAFRQLIRADETSMSKLALRYVIFGGEALDLASLNPWFTKHGDKSPRLVNMYGITETTVHVTYRPISWEDLATSCGSVIGETIPDLGIYLLDDNLELVPEGFPGEIFVAGAGVTRGYLNRAKLTAERFIPNPFGAGRLYRSGDLGRWKSNGDLEYLGRIDKQVKIRGFRIELGEIQEALISHPQVSEAFVTTDGEGEDKRLVAYYVASEAKSVKNRPVSELNQYLQSQLPNYMIPAGYVSLDAFPLTVNGKIDIKALPKPDWNLLRVEKEYVEPRNVVEKTLCQILESVLEQERVGIDDNLFDIGVDSIIAMRVVAEAQNQSLQVSIKDIYEHPTVRQLSALEELFKVESPDESTEVTLLTEADVERLPQDAEDAYPLSSLQAGMLYHGELHPDSAIFHDIFTFDLRLNYQESAWKKAITDVCQANPVLRTSFHWTGYSTPLQIVNRQVELPLTVYDLRSQGEESARQHVKAWLETEKTNSFDTSNPPLFRFVIHRLTEQEVTISFSFHHAILDGWSVATLMTQLLKRYAQYLQGEPASGLTSSDLSYKDFILREQGAIANEKMRDFWKQSLSGMEVSRVPRLKQGMVERDSQHHLKRLTVKIDDNLTDSLGEFANYAGVPLKTVLMAVHLRVLGFITGQSEVVTGSVLNGRLEKVGGENLLGLFLNTVPLRMQLQPDSWLELVKAVFAAENEIIPYRYFPLPEIQRLVGRYAERRPLGLSPLFEVGFNYVHFHVYEGILNLPGIECLGVEDFEETDFPFLVKFSLMPGGNGLQLDLVYDANQFESSQVEQYSKYYQTALSAAAVNPSETFTNKSLMSSQEKDNWLQVSNQDTVNHVSSETLVSCFAKAVENYPDKTAVAFNSTTLSFAELEVRADRLARYLRSKGVETGSFVGLCVERSSMLVVAILAILKAGAAYVPIDASYPEERINFILKDSGISLLLAEQATVSQVSACDREIIILEDITQEDIAAGLEDSSIAPVETPISPQNPAYVIYTSGSTGKPKGCVVTHGNVIRLFKSTQGWFNFNSNDVWTLFHSYAFDFSVWELWGALLHGGKVVVVPDWTRKSPQEFLQLLESEQVTVLNQTPSAFKQLIQADGEQPEKLSSLRYVIFGGEALELQSLQPWFQRYGDAEPKLINMYGITETTVHVTYREITQADVMMNRGSVIGEPIPDLSAYILDQYLEAVPVGVPGELYIGGAGVTPGYLHQPGLSAQRFIPNPFSKEPGSRLYRSGDLARRLPDGELEYLGRCDHQVKVRGFRIELGEIESVLVSNPQVKAAYVTAINGQIVAYFVSEEDNYTGVLRNYLKSKLPEYMVPGTLMQVELIPLTAHGKVDRKALPKADYRQSQQNYIAPTNEIEAKICSLMAGVLELEKVGITDNFFEIGGDSLKVTKLVTQLREVYQTDLPLPQVFSNRTPQALAGLIQGSVGSQITTSIKKRTRSRRRVELDNNGLLVGKE